MKIVINDMFYLTPCGAVAKSNKYDLHKVVECEKIDFQTRESTGELHKVDKVEAYAISLEYAIELAAHDTLIMKSEDRTFEVSEFRSEILKAIDEIGRNVKN